MDIENATRTRAFVIPLVENSASPEGKRVSEFLHVLGDSFSQNEVWPQLYAHVYVSLRSGRFVGKKPNVDEYAEPALQFDTEPAVEPEDVEQLPSNATVVEPEDPEPVPSNEILADNSQQPELHLDDARNDPDMPADTEDLPDVGMDCPLRVTFGNELRCAPTLAELIRCRRHRDGPLQSVPLPNVGPNTPYPSSLKGTHRRVYRHYQCKDLTSTAVWAAAYRRDPRTRHIYEVAVRSPAARHQLRDVKLFFDDGKFFHLSAMGKRVLVPRTLLTSIVAMYHESELYGHSGVLRTMALIKRNYVCSHFRHYVERYILSCDVCQADKSRRVDTARMPRPLPVPNTKWHSVSIDWVSGLPPTTRGHDAIMTVVDRFSKRGMFMPCRKDMTADDLIYVFLREVTRLKGCTRQILFDRDKLFKSQAWKEWAQRFKMEMHQTVANRPRGNGPAERSNQSILQRLRTHDIFGNNEWVLFAEIQFNNLASKSLRVSRFEIDEGRTPHFTLDIPGMTSHAHESSTVNDYMQQAERTFDSVHAMLAEERRRPMHVVLRMDPQVRVPEVVKRWWMLVPDYRHKWKLDVVWFGPYKVLEVLNKSENVKLDIPAPFDGLRVSDRDIIKPYIHREGQPVWEFPMTPVKSRDSPQLVKILARRRVGSKKRRTFLHRCEQDDDTLSWDSSKALEEDPVYIELF